jgi:hypothetical protein
MGRKNAMRRVITFTLIQPLQRYSMSCGLLMLPIALWNIALFDQLPPTFAKPVFWHEIPLPLATVEKTFQIIVFTLPFTMPLELDSSIQRRGVFVFTIGTLIYFTSWLALIFWPTSAWAISRLGFMAPAYTPAIWLFGLSLMGQRLFWSCNYRWWYFLLISGIFLAAHNTHTALVYDRIH